jgi:hypothetical protein
LRKAGGIALLILGLLALGVSYYVKTDADSGFNQAQCGNILGAVVGALYTSEAQACQHAKMMSTGGLVGIAIGVVMFILGIVSIAKSMGRDHQVRLQNVASVPRRAGPLDKNCRICRKDVKWWQSRVKQDNGLLHEECYWNERRQRANP